MKSNLILGALVAAGFFGAMNARAQETTAQAAPGPAGQNEQPPAYGTYVGGPATVDADGVPVAKPNPMSDFLHRSREEDLNRMPIEEPLEDDQRPDSSASGQTK